jgi:hypothetical protein
MAAAMLRHYAALVRCAHFQGMTSMAVRMFGACFALVVLALLITRTAAAQTPAGAPNSLLRAAIHLDEIEMVRDVAVDARGYVYVTGSTISPGQWSTDVIVRKYSPNLSRVIFSLVFGGEAQDIPRALAVDTAGAVYVTGETSSTAFPVVGGIQAAPGGGNDAFLVKVTPTGDALAYATLLGGSGWDAAEDVAVDDRGRAHVLGSTYSTDFPTTDSALDSESGGGFIARVNAAGTRLAYSRLTPPAYALALGPTGAAHFVTDEWVGRLFILSEAGAILSKKSLKGFLTVRALAVDPSGYVVIAGSTTSSALATRHALQPTHGGVGAFVTKLSATGTVVFTTYFGGTGVVPTDPEDPYGAGTSISDLAVDRWGRIYIAGSAAPSGPVPLLHSVKTPDTMQDAFIAKLTPDGRTLYYSTLLGGSHLEYAPALAVDSSGHAYAAGTGYSSDFLGGGSFVARLRRTAASDVGVIGSPRTLAPLAGRPLEYVFSVLNGATKTAWATVTIELPSGLTPVACSAGRAVCEQTSRGWRIQLVNLPATSTSRVVVTALPRCDLPNGRYRTAAVKLQSSAAEDPTTRSNNRLSSRVEIRNDAPAIERLTASPEVIEPAAGTFTTVTLDYTASDACSSPRCAISVSSPNADATRQDWQVVNARQVRVRATAGSSDMGRVYAVHVRCTDSIGNVSVRTKWIYVKGQRAADVRVVRSGEISLARDYDDGGFYTLAGDRFDLSGTGPTWVSYGCGKCLGGSILDLTQGIVFSKDSNTFSGTVDGHEYSDIYFKGELVLSAAPTVLTRDETLPVDFWDGADAPFIAFGNLIAYSSAGKRLFDLRLAGSGNVSAVVRGNTSPEDPSYWIREAYFRFIEPPLSPR